jgi:hypothetical protein
VTLWEHDPSDEPAVAGARYLMKNKRKCTVLFVDGEMLRYREDGEDQHEGHLMRADAFERQILEKLA